VVAFEGMKGPFPVAPNTPGGQALIADCQAKLSELLEQDELEDTSLSEFLAVLLAQETDRAGVEAQLAELQLDDMAPQLLDW
jgi:hypothetical protein